LPKNTPEETSNTNRNLLAKRVQGNTTSSAASNAHKTFGFSFRFRHDFSK
jgi:hypothetical protein